MDSGRLEKRADTGTLTQKRDRKMAEIKRVKQTEISKLPSDPSRGKRTKDSDSEVRRKILEIKTESKTYRDTFKDDWKEIEEQINCVKPANWDKKEDWQTKIYVGLQSKTSETAASMFEEIMFPTKRFYSLKGVEEMDRNRESALTTLMDTLMYRGKFFPHNHYVQQESIDFGTSFMKVLVNKEGTGLTFSWRSLLNMFPDPNAIVDFQESKYIGEEYPEDISDIMQNPLYKDSAKDELLNHLAGKSEQADVHDLIEIPNVSGNAYLKISNKYQRVMLYEHWGQVPVKKTKKVKGKDIDYFENENRVVTIASDKVTMRDEPNPYGTLPYLISRKKRKKYHIYGNGYHYNTRGLQELMNSLVNIGFDSLKINSFDIILLDRSAVADASSIEYRPLAVWEMKEGRLESGVRIQRNQQSAIHEIFKGVTMLDGIHQEVSGVTRHAQGSPTTSKNQQETLGEYQLKLQAISKRFIKVAREDEEDYIVPLLRLIFKIITNPNLFSQEAANRILGMDTQQVQFPNPMTGQPTMQQIQVPKLNLEELAEMDLDFKAMGTVYFQEKTDVINKLKSAMDMVLQSEQLTSTWNIEDMFDRFIQMLDIPDHESFKYTEQEMQEMRQQMMQQMQEQEQKEGIQSIMDTVGKIVKYDATPQQPQQGGGGR